MADCLCERSQRRERDRDRQNISKCLFLFMKKVSSDGMNARRSTLGSADMQPALVEFDLMPFEAADLRSPQAVTIGDQDHRCVAMGVSADLASSVHQPL